jgi:hypothetical protein
MFLHNVACDALENNCTWTDQGIERLALTPLPLGWKMNNQHPSYHIHDTILNIVSLEFC